MPKVLDRRENERRLTLYRQGMGDASIGRALGVKPNVITRWRRARGLSTNQNKDTPSLSRDEAAQRMLCYQLGWSDYHIARELGRSREAIYGWRRRHGLPANFGLGELERNTRRPTMRDVQRRIRIAVGYGLPPDIIDDTVSDICLAVLDGSISLDVIEREARRFGSRTMTLFASQFRSRSLDAPIGEDDFTLMDTLVDERSSSWLEEMGATVW